MKEATERKIALNVLTNGKKHCDSLCPFLSNISSCSLFGGQLIWDKRRKFNGWIRLQECKDSEVKS